MLAAVLNVPLLAGENVPLGEQEGRGGPGDAYFGPSGRLIPVEVEGLFRSKWKGCSGDVALPFRHIWHAREHRNKKRAG